MERDTRQSGQCSTRAFRALLALYPGEFRDEYGRELALVFADRYRDAPNVWERLRVWFEAITGVLKEAPQEHVRLLVQDLRYAIRLVRRSPGFTTTAVLTLALGIGANTAIFQLIDAVRFRSLPITSPGELVEVRIVGGNQGFGVNPGRYGQLTRPVWEELRRNQQAFAGLFAWSDRDVRVGEVSDFRHANGLAVSGDFLGVLAALLVMVGLYGMISFAVAARRQEIGVRVALGAHRWQVIAMIMREAGGLLIVGIIAGGAISLVAARSAATLLFGLKPHDPMTLLAACLVLIVVAAVASFVPARTASRLDPLVALRHE